ncbi:MAG: hypothetical protein RID91_14380 [Azospirillaceae bacterium]
MSDAPKVRTSVPLDRTVAVDTREVNVAVEGVDRTAISGSFTVHLLKDGAPIASRFLCQPTEPEEAVETGGEDRFARFDFVLPIEVVADGLLSVAIEPLETDVRGASSLSDATARATLTVSLMLQTE